MHILCRSSENKNYDWFHKIKVVSDYGTVQLTLRVPACNGVASTLTNVHALLMPVALFQHCSCCCCRQLTVITILMAY